MVVAVAVHSGLRGRLGGGPGQAVVVAASAADEVVGPEHVDVTVVVLVSVTFVVHKGTTQHRCVADLVTVVVVLQGQGTCE